MKKYEMTDEWRQAVVGNPDIVVYRIRALRDIERHKVKKGDLGGFIAYEGNLSQDGDCWVAGNASVYEGGRVEGNAVLHDYARVSHAAVVKGNAIIAGGSVVFGASTVVEDHAVVLNKASVGNGVHLCGQSCVIGSADVRGIFTHLDKGGARCVISDKSAVSGQATVDGHVTLCGVAKVTGCSKILAGLGRVVVSGQVTLDSDTYVESCQNTTLELKSADDKPLLLSGHTKVCPGYNLQIEGSGTIFSSVIYSDDRQSCKMRLEDSTVHKVNVRSGFVYDISFSNAAVTYTSLFKTVHDGSRPNWKLNVHDCSLVDCECFAKDGESIVGPERGNSQRFIINRTII